MSRRRLEEGFPVTMGVEVSRFWSSLVAFCESFDRHLILDNFVRELI